MWAKLLYRSIWTVFKKTPRVAQFALTNWCNGRCKVCSIWKQKKKVTVSLKDGLYVIDRLAKMGILQLTFTGGEPLMNPHVYRFIKHANKLGMMTSVCVGDPRLINKSSLIKMKKSGLNIISISMDTDDSALNDKLRGIKNSFEHFKRIVSLVKKSRIALVAAPTITEYTWNRVPQILATARKIGFHFINISYPTKSLSKTFQIGGEGTSHINLSRKQKIHAIDSLLKHINNGNNPYVTNPEISLQNIRKFLIDPKTVDHKCLGGWQVFSIDWFCDVYSCWRSNINLGSILDQNFRLVKTTHNSCTMSWFRDFSSLFQLDKKDFFMYMIPYLYNHLMVKIRK
ncbi:MAG: radical SAM protein [Spirochaetales bacterium]|nr:radical SAM protein [Spirochaetales bacterium]